MHIVIFDDHRWENFKPLTHTRSVGDLRVGILKLRQRLLSFFGSDENSVIIPSFLKKLYQERHPDWDINITPLEMCLFINSRLKVTEAVIRQIESLKAGEIALHGEEVLAFCTKGSGKPISTETLTELTTACQNKILIEADTWQYTWELVSENSNWIKKDFEEFFYDKDNYFETEVGVTVLNPYQVWLGEGVELKPGVVIDASGGPIVIDENAKIMSNSVIIGPVYIGKNSIIKVGAKIYEGTSIGPLCKVGGEVEETIIQGYSNKQHDGFLGHSYLGEWVNIGADTNNSDLKNNYSNVKMYVYPVKEKRSTSTQFMGSIIGDHTKIGINCSINTGTVIGAGSNLYGKDMITDFVPDLSWGEYSSIQKYKLGKFIETAQLVKARRKMLFTKTEEEIFKYISEESD
jgi:UDP-N-acetylglucosamine diphosphorylase / glucose-1-phosphate thymidylyltransferase / UDP-N-acetylgalactosamine diphosphorylase / glucosamine-1-phosphate N-acetyltransferase / galactosamine-1-phosphate N-acetyltransferase